MVLLKEFIYPLEGMGDRWIVKFYIKGQVKRSRFVQNAREPRSVRETERSFPSSQLRGAEIQSETP